MTNQSEPVGDEARASSPNGAGSVVLAWVPNLISFVRIALVPVWVVVASACRDAASAGDAGAEQANRAAAVVVLCTIGISDVLDGYLARRFGLATRLGATVDALADKLAQVALLVFFALCGEPAFARVPIWFLVLILARDVLLGIGSTLLKLRHGRVRVVHRPHGKLSSVLLFALLLWITVGLPAAAVDPALLAIAAVVALSTLGYIRDGVRQVRVDRPFEPPRREALAASPERTAANDRGTE